jgi:hypothetical protein
MLDGNYEAQREFARERLASRRAEAEAERGLRSDQPARLSGLKAFLGQLFRRTGARDEESRKGQSPRTRLAQTERGKGQFA